VHIDLVSFGHDRKDPRYVYALTLVDRWTRYMTVEQVWEPQPLNQNHCSKHTIVPTKATCSGSLASEH